MENIIVDHYIIHFNQNPKIESNWIYFNVYPISIFIQSNNETYFEYIDKEEEPDTLKQFDENKALVKLSGMFCWRGVWEGRLSFPDDEYWGEEIQELSSIYNEHIVPYCKDIIKKRDPSNTYDD